MPAIDAERAQSADASPSTTPSTGYPPPQLPTIYADGVASVSPSNRTVRFYLYRADPDVGGSAALRNQIIAQVIMPLDSFITTAVFFDLIIDGLVKQGFVIKEEIDKVRDAIKASINI